MPLRNPCIEYLPRDCERFVLCVLESKGYIILSRDAQGYDILATHPASPYLYFIEVKHGSRAVLSPRQRELKERIDFIRHKHDKNIKYVVCHFDDEGRLIGDSECKKLLRGYLP